MYGSVAKVGIIVPSQNTVMEPEFQTVLLPLEISVHASRLRWSEGKAVSSVDNLEKINYNDLELASIQLGDAHVDLIVYGCTSGSFVGGQEWNKRIINFIESKSGSKSITTSSSIIDALAELRMKSIDVVTPYPSEVNQRLISYLKENHINVRNLSTFNEPDMLKHAEIRPESILELGKKTFTEGSDGIFIPCTQLRALEVVASIEQAIGRPVVTAVQATLWQTLKSLGIRRRISGYGRLLSGIE
jgi:maleate cis-trans isomerase